MPAERVATSASASSAMREMTASTSWCMRPAAVDLQGVLDAVEPGPQFVAPLDGQLVRQAVVLGQQFGPGPQSAGDLVEHRAAEPLGHFLREHGGDEPLLPGDFALRRLDFALDQPQERGLARPVAAQQADPLAGLEREVGLIQHQRAAKAQTDVAQRNQCHPCMCRLTRKRCPAAAGSSSCRG